MSKLIKPYTLNRYCLHFNSTSSFFGVQNQKEKKSMFYSIPDFWEKEYMSYHGGTWDIMVVSHKAEGEGRGVGKSHDCGFHRKEWRRLRISYFQWALAQKLCFLVWCLVLAWIRQVDSGPEFEPNKGDGWECGLNQLLQRGKWAAISQHLKLCEDRIFFKHPNLDY
jgi:hypothetical protein